MAAIAHRPAPDMSSPINDLSIDTLASNVHHVLPRGLAVADLDLRDSRYPKPSSPPRPSALFSQPSTQPASSNNAASYRNQDPSKMNAATDSTFDSLQMSQQDAVNPIQSQLFDTQYPTQGHIKESYPPSTYPPGASPPRIGELNGFGDGIRLFSSSLTSFLTSKPPPGDTNPREGSAASHSPDATPSRPSWQPSMQDQPQEGLQSSPLAPEPDEGPDNQMEEFDPLQMINMSQTPYGPAIPIPVSPKLRVAAQQPTYITPSDAPSPINPVYSRNPPAPVEEVVCLECAMRDQDMADVDVTSPGIWDRESDVHFEDLKRREEEEAFTGALFNDPKRPRAQGGRLSEQNLKLWLSLNPKEPASKRQALDLYLKTQRSLLEAEALAHARAVQESKQLDSRMRDAYSQVRNPVYDLKTNGSPVDELGGVHTRTPRSATMPNPSKANGHSVTLLENGLIVEHVDVRKEAREVREWRRQEERRERARARKSSRSSVVDASSFFSSPPPHADSGYHLGTSSGRYSSHSRRPSSAIATPVSFSTLPQAFSNASVSDVHSLSASSPNRRTRLFGARHFSTGWRSQDSLAPSGYTGSMVDMHVALQNDRHMQSPSDLLSSTQSATSRWRHSTAVSTPNLQGQQLADKPKKKGGFARILRLVIGSSSKSTNATNLQSRSLDRGQEDDYPLDPPPPLSYLVNRGSGEPAISAFRHVSTPSLPSSASPNNVVVPLSGVSPPTAPSSILPSPTSSRPFGASDTGDGRKNVGHVDRDGERTSSVQEGRGTRSIHLVTSEPDIRQTIVQSQSQPPKKSSSIPVARAPTSLDNRPRSSLSWRDKILPPIPGEAVERFPGSLNGQTRASFDPYSMTSGEAHGLVAPQAPFRQDDVRRQSFSGMAGSPNMLVQGRMSSYIYDGHPALGNYDKFGSSNPALTPLDGSRHNQPRPYSVTNPKRKSKFGFSSLLRKRNSGQEPTLGVEFPVSPLSASEARQETMVQEMGSSGSGHVTHPRLSMMSRKNIDQLVDQAPDFVAYRYPSTDQNTGFPQ